jgi:hypothetical protein
MLRIFAMCTCLSPSSILDGLPAPKETIMRNVAGALVLITLGLLMLAPRPLFAAASPSRSHAVSVSALVLAAADVKSAYGSGFRPTFSQVISNKVANAAYASLGVGGRPLIVGRITGYERGFSRNLASFSKGKVTVGNGVNSVIGGVNAYKTSRGPQLSMTYELKVKFKPPKGLTYHLSHLSGVGDVAVLETIRTALKGIPTSYGILIAFARGRYTADVIASAYGSPPSESSVLALAKLMDGRIQASG